MKTVFILMSSLAAAMTLLSQSVPSLMNYQGRLTDESGAPLPNGIYRLVFRLFDADLGGSRIWGETNLVTLLDGNFNVLLGSGTREASVPPLPPLDAAFAGTNRYLELTVISDPTGAVVNRAILPRQRILSTAFAFQALNASTAALARVSQTLDAAYIQNALLNQYRSTVLGTVAKRTNFFSGTNTWTAPTNISANFVILHGWGGGGGGGAGSAGSSTFATPGGGGGAGGGGAFPATQIVAIAPGSSYLIAVGVGGAGATTAGAGGGGGGTTSFGGTLARWRGGAGGEGASATSGGSGVPRAPGSTGGAGGSYNSNGSDGRDNIFFNGGTGGQNGSGSSSAGGGGGGGGAGVSANGADGGRGGAEGGGNGSAGSSAAATSGAGGGGGGGGGSSGSAGQRGAGGTGGSGYLEIIWFAPATQSTGGPIVVDPPFPR